MTPNEIYALDDLDEKSWYALKKNNCILVELFPVLLDLSVDFDRAKAGGNNRFSLCLKIRTPVGRSKNLACWALMFDGRPFGFFVTYAGFDDDSSDVDVDMSSFDVYITDSTLWREAEDLVCSYVGIDTPISGKFLLSLPVLDGDQALIFQPGAPTPAFVDGMALVVPMVPNWHQTQDEIVAFNALIYHRLLNELIEREGEEKLKQRKWWTSRSPIVEEISRIVLLSVPKGIEARVGSGMVKDSYGGQQRALAILRFDSGTYGLIIQKGACLQDYQNSDNIILLHLGESNVFGSAHERMKWISEDPRWV